MKARTFVGGIIATSLLLVGCGADDAPSTEVALQNITFSPATVEVAVGDEVTWTNEDSVAHTVTSGTSGEQGVPGVDEGSPSDPDGVFDEGLSEEGDAFSFTFEEEGTYAYFCEIHPAMTGEVIVTSP